ncbi:hypothetical phage protein [Shigella phage Ag3]|uniref:Hypothetical phage protein n=1 Tax=Shigella phage Ag3 TaxID=637730 RepID=C8XUB4_9CAUD|nr:hypothetical protein phiSboM-AG3_gp010 [Shigella phage Ag3]ACO94244.1 hypothetical phage protein [Shigella phage Ag3]
MMLLMSVPQNKMTPETEGKNHFNIYSQSQTELGRFLSHFAHHPVTTYEHGVFNSMEGYWYWLKYRDDNLRLLDGYEAKQYGQGLAATRIAVLDPSSEEFKRDILFATSMKLQTMPDLLKIRLAYSRLPLIHAYVRNGKYSFQNSMDFIIDHINRLRIQGTLK